MGRTRRPGLFATLAVPIAYKSTVKLMNEIGVKGEDSYLFEVINNYVYVGMLFTPKMMWPMIKAMTNGGKMPTCRA